MVKRKKKTTISASSCRAARQKLPDGLKEKFGSIGFVKWTCAHCPVLIVDPMQMVLSHTLPEGIYHAWLYQVHLHAALDEDDGGDDKEKDMNKDATIATDDDDARNETSLLSDNTLIDMLPVLIYWYGTCYEFSIVRLSQIIAWDVGCERGYNILPTFMSRRIQKLHRPVPAVYSLLEDALLKLDGQALDLAPEQRSLAIIPPGNKKKHQVVLNEWHALAMEAPPQQHSWMEQRQAMEPTLPHREWFGQIAFMPHKCGSYDYHHPVLVMNPFRVPPNHRAEWFHKCSSGELVMVYWLGSYTAGRVQQNVFTCHKLNELIPYKEAIQQGLDKLPKQVLQEYGNPNLSSKRVPQIDCWVCGMEWELPEALKREPQDRWGGLEDFEEDHDDNFDYFWECLTSAKEANEARGKNNNNNNNNGDSTTDADKDETTMQRLPSTRTRPSDEDEIVDNLETETEDDNDDDDDDEDHNDDDGDDEELSPVTDPVNTSSSKSKRTSRRRNMESSSDSNNGVMTRGKRENSRIIDDCSDQEPKRTRRKKLKASDRPDDIQIETRQSGRQTSTISNKSKHSDGKFDGYQSTKSMEPSSRVTFPLREEAKDDDLEEKTTDGVPSKKDKSVQPSSSTLKSLHDDLDHAVRSSLSHCAAILSEDSTTTTEVASSSSSSKRKTPDHHQQGQSSTPTRNGVVPSGRGQPEQGTNSGRQKDVTEKIVKDVIQQWTQVKQPSKN